MLDDIRRGYVSVGGAREDYGVVVDGDRVDASGTADLRAEARASRVAAEVVPSAEDEYDAQRRRIVPVGLGIAQAMELADGDVLEIVNPRGAHLRAWARVAADLPDRAMGLGPRGISIAGVGDPARAELRTPWTYCMRRQAEDSRFHA